jgi:hypothetical protein
MYFKLGLETAPVLGCLVLLASTCIPGSVVTDGIGGSEGVRPYDIMTLFISFVSLSTPCPLGDLAIKWSQLPWDINITISKLTTLYNHEQH